MIASVIQGVRYLLGRPGFYGSYRSFADAERASIGYTYTPAGPPAVGPSEDERTAQVLAPLRSVLSGPVSVLDVGGADGSYFRRLAPHIKIASWTVFETPSLVAAMPTNGAVRFTSDVSALGRYDLVFMSGFVQYAADPYRMLREFVPRGRYALLNRLPLADRDQLTVQRGRGYSYPAWFLDRARFDAALLELGRKVSEWRVPQDVVRLNGRKITYSGMLIEVHATVIGV